MSRSIFFILIFLLIGLVVLAPIVPHFGADLIYPAHSSYSDLTITHWPAFAYIRDQWTATGQIPLWRTSILSGTPFAADPLSGLFYPPHWIAFIPCVPLALAFNLLMWLHISLAAATMYVLMRRWNVNRWAALTSALAYAVAPKIMAHLGVGHVTLVEAWAWLPLVIAALTPAPIPDRSSVPAGQGRGVWAGAALAMCLLADARMAVYALTLAVSYLLVVETTRDRKNWLNVGATIVLLVIVALALSAAAVFPAVTFTSNSVRASLSTSEAGVLSLDAAYVLGVVIADRSGAAERTTYFGLVVLALAIAGVKLNWKAQRRRVVWLLGVIAIGFVVALGTHTPLYDLITQLPGSTLLRVPARAWFVVTFAVAVLAGLGMDGLMNWTGRARHRSTLLAITIGLFAALFGLLGALTTRSASLFWLAIFAPAIIALIMLRVQHRLSAQRFAQLAWLLIALDLITLAWTLYRPVSLAEAFADGQEPAHWLAEQPDRFRVYSPSYSVPQQVGQQYQLQLADGIDPLQLRRYVQFMQLASGVGEWGYSVTLPAFPGAQTDEDIRTALSHIKPNPALLGLLNVKYVDAAFPIDLPELIERARFGSTYVYENTQTQPRAFVVGQIDVAANVDEALRWLTMHDVSQAVVVEGLPYPIRLLVQPHEAPIEDWSADYIRLRATGPGWLVLSEVVAPDWIARLDGQPVDIFITDVALRGVYVPWGDHTIEFEYQPRRVYAGVVISVLSVVAVAVVLEIKRAKRLQRVLHKDA